MDFYNKYSRKNLFWLWKVFLPMLLFCKIFAAKMIMLVFIDILETKGYESLATKVDISVEMFDVATCFEGPILRVDVATDTDCLVNEVDEACGTSGVILQVDVAANMVGLILTREVATSTKVERLWCKTNIATHTQDLQT